MEELTTVTELAETTTVLDYDLSSSSLLETSEVANVSVTPLGEVFTENLETTERIEVENWNLSALETSTLAVVEV